MAKLDKTSITTQIGQFKVFSTKMENMDNSYVSVLFDSNWVILDKLDTYSAEEAQNGHNHLINKYTYISNKGDK